MKRSIRWYLAWGTMVASLSMLFFIATAGPAQAYTQRLNQWDETGSGTGWCSGQGTNGTDSRYPCLYWKEAHYTSTNLYFYMDPSLVSSQSHGYDFNTAIHVAFTQFNNVSAWNPYMYQCFTPCTSYTVGDYFMSGALACGIYGHTINYITSTEYGYNPQRGGNEYYAFISSTVTEFNSTVYWNNTFDWTQTSCSNTHADGRATATHETGHVIGMGHTSDHLAVMNSDDLVGGNYYALTTTSDIPCIQAIYPGNQQSS